MQLEQEIVIKGRPICRGIAVGTPVFLNRHDFAIYETCISPAHMQREIDRYRYALSRSRQDIKRLQKQLEMEEACEGVLILEAQLEMLQDPLLTTDVEKEIKKNKKNAEFIFQQAVCRCQEHFQAMNNAFFKERFQDLQDLSRRIISYLNEVGAVSLQDLPLHSIVCAQEITASDAASAKSYYVCAFITESGGATSHAAIVAKSKGIPYITHINLEALKEQPCNQIIVDGKTGKIILNPSKETLEEYEQLIGQMKDQAEVLERVTRWPAETFDGFTVRLSANIDTLDEAQSVHKFNGDGIGLFRSEYLFLSNHGIPSEDEQAGIYRALLDKMEGLPVVIRTFDLGGDKMFAHPFVSQQIKGSLNPCSYHSLLKEQGILKTQLKAILRASIGKDIRILFPMISSLCELREIKAILQEARDEVKLYHPVRVGCMIEVPSAAITVDHLAKECDFLSIGTNDLVQYALAMDRTSSSSQENFGWSDPAIIRLIKLIVNEANKVKIPVGVCGEMASDPRFTALLLGLGIQELSVPPRYLPIIKDTVRRTCIVDAILLAEQVLTMTTGREILDVISQCHSGLFFDHH